MPLTIIFWLSKRMYALGYLIQCICLHPAKKFTLNNTAPTVCDDQNPNGHVPAVPFFHHCSFTFPFPFYRPRYEKVIIFSRSSTTINNTTIVTLCKHRHCTCKAAHLRLFSPNRLHTAPMRCDCLAELDIKSTAWCCNFVHTRACDFCHHFFAHDLHLKGNLFYNKICTRGCNHFANMRYSALHLLPANTVSI